MNDSLPFPTSPQNPGGVLFRFVFGQPEHAGDLLRSALPAETVASIDWASLRRVDQCCVDEAMGHVHADVVFAARIDDREGFVYMLLEGDGDERDTEFHARRYVGRLIAHWRIEHPEAAEAPPVVIHATRVGASPRRG